MRPPCWGARYSPVDPKVCVREARPATSSIADWLRASEAFISTTVQPWSAATASAAVVLPTPGGPSNNAARRAGGDRLSSHDFAQRSSSETARAFPRTSRRLEGRSRSESGRRSLAALTGGATPRTGDMELKRGPPHAGVIQRVGSRRLVGPEELIRLSTLLEFRIGPRGELDAFPWADAGDVPAFVVVRHRDGIVTYFQRDLAPPVRQRLEEVAPADIFRDPSRVGRVLGRRPSVGSRHEVLYVMEAAPRLVEGFTATRQGNHFVVLDDGRPASWAWTIREHARAEEGSVETVPTFRRRGYGRTALAAWARSVLDREKTPIVRRSASNVAAGELLRSVGASEFAESIAFP